MTKNERIAQNEREIEALRNQIAELGARLSALIARIAALEPMPIVPWYVPPMSDKPWYRPIVDDYCTCGTTAVCPIHGLHFRSYTVYPADVLPGTASERIT